jgi:dUTP pyrophosphatase
MLLTESNMKLEVYRNDPALPLPLRKTQGAAGYDLYARADGKVKKGEVFRWASGYSIKIPDGHVGILRGRSSLEVQGLHVLAGTIDSDYTKELVFVYKNLTQHEIDWKKGDRIAQLLIYKVETPPVEEVTSFEDNNRGGFGSTGK